MKNVLFWLLLLCSFATLACDEAPQSVGGATTDGGQGNSPGLSMSANSGETIADCYENDNITVTGFAYFDIQRLVVGIGYALNATGGGGGSFGEFEEEDGCHNIQGEYRKDAATASFVAARTKASRKAINFARFAARYRAGSTYTHTFPNGDKVDFTVGYYMASEPLTAEVANSCG